MVGAESRCEGIGTFCGVSAGLGMAELDAREGFVCVGSRKEKKLCDKECLCLASARARNVSQHVNNARGGLSACFACCLRRPSAPALPASAAGRKTTSPFRQTVSSPRPRVAFPPAGRAAPRQATHPPADSSVAPAAPDPAAERRATGSARVCRAAVSGRSGFHPS